MKKSFLWSLLGHILIILLMVLDLNFGFKKYESTSPAIMMVDLTKVKISNKTNLPQKTVPQKRKAVSVSPQKTPEKKEKTNKVPPQTIQKSAPKPIVKPKETPVKEAVPVKTEVLKKEEQQQPPSVSTTEKKINTDLQNLLASVEKVRKAPSIKENQTPSSENIIQGEQEGRIDQILTISERDYLASELQKCWNIDAGVEHADKIVVEIKAWINKDGSIRDVKIINSMSFSSFKTVAESAKRAIYICDHKGVDSPFRILAQKYTDYYADWKEISLHFNPLKGIN